MTALDRTFTATLQKSPARIGQQAGDSVTVHLDERLEPAPRRSPR
jgi:hypothetical protein